MLEKVLFFMNLSIEQVLDLAKNIKLSDKESESFDKGREFIDKQMELENDDLRNKVMLILLAYMIEKYPNQKNQ